MKLNLKTFSGYVERRKEGGAEGEVEANSGARGRMMSGGLGGGGDAGRERRCCRGDERRMKWDGPVERQ